MNTPTHEFVSVDMRGLKAALVGRARADRVSVSSIVRRAVERELGLTDAATQIDHSVAGGAPSGTTVKLSIRMARIEVEHLDNTAKRAGLSRGAFLAGLLAGVPSLSSGSASRPQCLAALTASCAELSTVARNVHHLGYLLRRGDGPQVREYRRRLETMDEEVRAHLRLAAATLAELQPARPGMKR